MLDAAITIERIEYENTLQHIFPLMSPKIAAMDSDNMVVRLFQQLGDAALPVMCSLMYRLPEDTKDEILIRGLNAFAPILKEKLNEELRKDKWGQCFQIGTIRVERQEGILLRIGRVRVDYSALINLEQVSDALGSRLGRFSPWAKAAAGVATALASGMVEKQGLALLEKESNKARLLALLQSTLSKYGVEIGVQAIRFTQSENPHLDYADVSQPFALTARMEEDIIAALAGYLRDSLPAQPHAKGDAAVEE